VESCPPEKSTSAVSLFCSAISTRHSPACPGHLRLVAMPVL
jgi:hypothetical protein